MIDIEYGEMIVSRLDSLGYVVTTNDIYTLRFLAEKESATIKNTCNVSTLPEGLMYHYVDAVCGEFLKLKYNTNQLDDSTFNVDDAIASVSMGDVSVSYDAQDSSVTKFNKLIDALINGKKDELVCYRKIRW